MKVLLDADNFEKYFILIYEIFDKVKWAASLIVQYVDTRVQISNLI